MSFPEATFKIVEDKDCPLYELGDELILSDIALLFPPGQPACITLVEDIRQVLTLFESLGEIHEDKESGSVFDCSGCTGKILLEYKSREASASREERKRRESDISATANLLSNFSIFQAIDEHNIRYLVTFLKLRKFRQGETIIKKGDPGVNLFIIVSGKVEVLGNDGMSITFLEKGEVFGEMSLLSGDPVGATIKVVDPTTILYINGKDFRKVLKRFPDLQMYFARLLAQRLAKTNVVRSEEIASGMIGQLSEMPPSELFQTLNTNQKTGVLNLSLPKGSADLFFRDGCLIGVKYNEEESEKAFYEILKETEGRFKFVPGLPPDKVDAEELGDFMWLLMEGIRRMDEEKGENEI